MRPHVLHWLAGFMPSGLANALAPTWFTCVGLAGLAGLISMLVVARRRGLDPATVASAVMWAYVAAVVAGIFVPMVITGFQHAFATGHFELRWSGMTSFWGYLAGAAAIVVVCDREHVAVADFADAAVIPLGISLVFARLGCFMAGCDYGKVTSVAWGVRFPAGSPAWRDHVHAGLISSHSAESLPVHPTELYEAMIGLAIIAVGIVVARRRHDRGAAFLAAAATYAIGRLFVETLRGDDARGIYAGVSSGQIFCLLVLAAIAMRFVVARRRAVVAIVAVTLGWTIGDVGEAAAQPAPEAFEPAVEPTEPPPAPVADDPPPLPPETIPAPPRPLRRRPPLSIGLLFGEAAALDRPAEQVPSLTGTTVSFGYVPGRFGLWLDVDHYTNSIASHDTLLVSTSFAPRITSRLWLGARTGLGVTQVDFQSPAFHDVTAKTFRIEAIAEYVLGRQWTIWCRPLAIDVLSSPELGGAITTMQFRIGASYRFGQRGGPYQ